MEREREREREDRKKGKLFKPGQACWGLLGLLGTPPPHGLHNTTGSPPIPHLLSQLTKQNFSQETITALRTKPSEAYAYWRVRVGSHTGPPVIFGCCRGCSSCSARCPWTPSPFATPEPPRGSMPCRVLGRKRSDSLDGPATRTPPVSPDTRAHAEQDAGMAGRTWSDCRPHPGCMP